MKKKNFLLGAIAVAIVLFYSCSQKESESNHIVLNIKLPPPNQFDFKDVFDSIQVIPLEFTENSTLHYCEKALMYKNKYYIFDRKTQSIYVFDAFGHFLYNSSDKRGGGPEEYLSVTDFDIDNNTGDIYLLSASSLKLMIYDEQFNYKETVKLPTELLPLGSFKRLSTDYFAFYNFDRNDDFCLNIYSKQQGEIINKTCRIKNREEATLLAAFEGFPLHGNGDCIYFTNRIPDNKLYHYNAQSHNFDIYLKYIIENKEFSIDKIKKGRDQAYYRRIIEKDSYAFIMNQRENKSFLFTFILYKTTVYFTIYDKKQSTVKTFTSLFDKEAYLMPPDFIDDQCLYVIVEPMYLEKQISDKYLTESSREVIKNVDIDNDNQLIVKYYIKKDKEL
jgi:hypothetical protein